MEEMLKENEMVVEENNEVKVYDLEPVEESNDSGSGIGGKLIVAGILALAGAAGALVWKKKKESSEGTLTKADLKAIERLEKKGFTVCEPVADAESTKESEPETESEEETQEEKK